MPKPVKQPLTLEQFRNFYFLMGREKACMKEMSQRLFNMFERDPELQKYAEYEGLTKNDLKEAGKTAKERRKEVDVKKIVEEEDLVL